MIWGKAVRPKRVMTVKEWKRYKVQKEKFVGNTVYYMDLQEWMCSHYNIILTDYKTSKEKIVSILKGFNMKNFDKGMAVFDGAMKEFDSAMKDFGKELGDGSNNNNNNLLRSQKGKKNIQLWGTNNNTKPNIWGDNPTQKPKRKRKTRKKKSKSKDEDNLSKIWGKNKKR